MCSKIYRGRYTDTYIGRSHKPILGKRAKNLYSKCFWYGTNNAIEKYAKIG
jgi:hypothetical protein